MDHLATELAHPPQRRLDVVDLEVRQRIRVPGSPAPLVHAEQRGAARRLPALALVTRAIDEFDTQDPSPEPSGTYGIVGRELDEVQWRAHDHTIRSQPRNRRLVGRNIGADRAGEFGRRTQVEGVLLVSVSPDRVITLVDAIG
jgi:hypothetical protein